ncbi:MAG: ABC transporter substrate-binding protein [Gammaproteobacteria bacterium]|nr:ABC transporter substrate-binding protein [Gammaproteobacteria bacterium]MDH5345208.1 ABC transporter substrate-binding protein [Gammaproteobacteria bacterium]
MQRILFTVCGLLASLGALAAEQGLYDDRIIVGQVSDLSGATAVWGVPTTNGTRMRFDEVNAAGGIHGRRLELVVEDGQYQVPISVKAANKLLNRDKVFVMLGNMGTPANNAIMPRQLNMGVANLFPVSAAVSMYEPLHRMKFSYFVSYRDQVRGGVRYFTQKLGASKVCLQTQATDYGHEGELGYLSAVDELGLDSVYLGRHKVTETDFVGTVTRLKNSGCEVLFIGTIVTDTIQLYTAVRKAGWDVPVVGNMVVLHPLIADAADGGMEGLYSAGPVIMADLGEDSEQGRWRRDWHAAYRKRFGEDANIQAQVGYVTADLMIRAMEAAGRDLTTEKMLAELEKIRNYEDPFGGPSLSFGPDKHQGSDSLYLSRIVDGRWTVIEKDLPY